VANLQVPNIGTPASVENTLSARWGIKVQFKGEKPKLWITNTRYEVESVIPVQTPKMTELMIA
jgi:hypothetical protein